MKSHSFIIQINILFLIPFSSGFPLTEYASLVFAMMRVNSTKSKTNVQYQILASYIRLQFSRKFIRKKRRSLYAQRKKNWPNYIRKKGNANKKKWQNKL